MPNIKRQQPLMLQYYRLVCPALNKSIPHGLIKNDSPDKIPNLRVKMQFMAIFSLATMKRRAKLLAWKYRKGRPMYKRPGNLRMVIYPKDLVRYYGMEIRSAQRLLARTRLALGKPPRSLVTIEDFCFIHKEKEAKIFAFINNEDESGIKATQGVVGDGERRDDETDGEVSSSVKSGGR